MGGLALLHSSYMRLLIEGTHAVGDLSTRPLPTQSNGCNPIGHIAVAPHICGTLIGQVVKRCFNSSFSGAIKGDFELN